MKCPLFLPCPDHALLPTKTCSVSTDSTLADFRHTTFRALREVGYDLIHWEAWGGAWEIEVAKTPYTSGQDLVILVPNGNRLAKQKESRLPHWLPIAVAELARSARRSAKAATVFVGHPSATPSLANPVYHALHEEYTSRLRTIGLSVVSDAPNIELGSDNYHWSKCSAPAVATLVKDLVKQASPTSSLDVPAARNWSWKYLDQCGKYYPHCDICDSSTIHLLMFCQSYTERKQVEKPWFRASQLLT